MQAEIVKAHANTSFLVYFYGHSIKQSVETNWSC